MSGYPAGQQFPGAPRPAGFGVPGKAHAQAVRLENVESTHSCQISAGRPPFQQQQQQQQQPGSFAQGPPGPGGQEQVVKHFAPM